MFKALNDQIYCVLKYASEDNFMGFKLYKSIKRPYLQPDVAERLSKCQDYLTEIDSTLHLLIYDAAKPVCAEAYVESFRYHSSSWKGKVCFKSLGIEAFIIWGAAVDITICNDEGIPLDMGAPSFDEFAEIAYPRMEAIF